ncbi:hypothetical protein B4134_2908 [Bacillus safensis]|nr:hypothetical protein B4134_2908 [Bacillus safensis]
MTRVSVVAGRNIKSVIVTFILNQELLGLSRHTESTNEK